MNHSFYRRYWIFVFTLAFGAFSLVGCPTSRGNDRDNDPPSNNRVSVPDVVGRLQSTARSAITNAGLVVAPITEEYSETVGAGYVISQTPVGGTRVSSGSLVHLVVSRGIPPEEHVTVPDVVGMTRSGAEQEILSSGLMLATVTEAYSDSVETGRVIRQEPAAGASVRPGGTVSLVVSRGADNTTEVPDVVGMPLSDAEVVLDGVGLTVGTVTEGYSDSVPTGRVISQEPLPGANVVRGSAIQLVVSLGFPPEDTLDGVGSILLNYSPPSTWLGFDAVNLSAQFGIVSISLEGLLPNVGLDTCFLSDDFVENPAVSIRPLEPGEPGEISIGTERAYLWKYIYPIPDDFSTPIQYAQDPFFIKGRPGDLVNIFWPGGVDIKTFSYSTQVIHDPVFLHPQLLPDTALSINFDRDLSLIWETHDHDTSIIFVITTTKIDDGLPVSACVTCLLRDDGSFTLPRHYLQAIKPDGEFMYSVNCNRQKIERTIVDLEDGTSGQLSILWNSQVGGTGYYGK